MTRISPNTTKVDKSRKQMGKEIQGTGSGPFTLEATYAVQYGHETPGVEKCQDERDRRTKTLGMGKERLLRPQEKPATRCSPPSRKKCPTASPTYLW